uniref:Uncharacterized protein n=1 Tax=Arundo donax TaxID=35708 RepID=A0A0A9FPI4_ARUDO
MQNFVIIHGHNLWFGVNTCLGIFCVYIDYTLCKVQSFCLADLLLLH